MTSYHDIEKQTCDRIWASPFERIPPIPSWRHKVRIKKQAEVLAIGCYGSYNWAGDFGLLVLIKGTAHYTTENRGFSAYTQPVRPPSSISVTLPGGELVAQI